MSLKKRLVYFAFLILAVVTVGINSYLLVEHYRFLSGGRAGNSVCNISSYFNCDAVTASPYAELAGFSNGAWGLGVGLFLSLLGMVMVTRKEHQQSQPYLALATFLLSGALLYGIWLSGISFLRLKASCIFCLALHFSNLIMLLLLWANSPTNFWQTWLSGVRWFAHGLGLTTSPIGRRGTMMALYVLMAICFGISLSWDYNLDSKTVQRTLQRQEPLLEHLRSQPPRQINIDGSPTFGNPSSKLTVVVFSDFACPFCRKAAFVTEAVLRQYESQLRWVFKHYPLDADCNRNSRQTIHPNACAVARGSHCADAQGKFREFHDAAFSQLKPFDVQAPLHFAKSAGLDLDAFQTCMRDADSFRAVARDIDQAQRMGVEGTPAFYFNGRNVSGLVPAPLLKAIVEESLKLPNPE